jgi:putative Holliday junction resolvase
LGNYPLSANNYQFFFVQDKQITNSPNISDILSVPSGGRVIALDIGTKRFGVAVCDELQVTVRPLPVIRRKSWKELLITINSLITEFDAVALVLGLPYNFDGSESEMSIDARRLHRNFSLSLPIPVFLQDERLSSRSAHERLHQRGYNLREIMKMIDSEAASIILSDFLELKESIKKNNLNIS